MNHQFSDYVNIIWWSTSYLRILSVHIWKCQWLLYKSKIVEFWSSVFPFLIKKNSHMYWRKGFSYMCFVIAFNIRKSLFLPFQKAFMFLLDFLCFLPLFGHRANTARIYNWPYYGWALTCPMERQLYESRFAFHVHSSMLSFLKWDSGKPLSTRNNKRLVGTRFALLLFKVFYKGILGNAVFQNPVLTS